MWEHDSLMSVVLDPALSQIQIRTIFLPSIMWPCVSTVALAMVTKETNSSHFKNIVNVEFVKSEICPTIWFSSCRSETWIS